MIGRKLDARSYTVLLLAVIAVLLTLNLAAQRNITEVSSAAATQEVATATNEVASATREVAGANKEIASAIRELASAVQSLDLSVVVNTGESQGRSATSASQPGTATGAADAGDEEPGPGYEGTFTIN